MILLRHAVAALLNAEHPDISYPMSGADVISQVNAALASNDRSIMLALASALDASNNLGCPISGKSVRGTVTDAFGNPLEGATVLAQADPYDDSATWRTATSDAQGSYVIDDLPAGSYYVAAVMQPYIVEFHDGVRWPDKATPVEVAKGASASDVDFSLEIGGTISGVVEDPQGNPIEGARVHPIPYDHDPPWWWGLFLWAGTSADGSYTVSGLPTGSYIVWAEAQFSASEYYENVPAHDDASPVRVVEGSNTPNIDFSLAPACIDRLGDTQCDSPDFDPDDDGCATVEEAALGSVFDGSPAGWYDVYDVPVPARADSGPGSGANGVRDKVVDMRDALAVLFYAFTEENPSFPGCGDNPNANGVDYDCVKGVDLDGDTGNDIPPPLQPIKEGLKYDRSPGPGPDPATGIDPAGPPDGTIDLRDLLATVAQAFVVDCISPP
jgi:hypothetical protein